MIILELSVVRGVAIAAPEIGSIDAARLSTTFTRFRGISCELDSASRSRTAFDDRERGGPRTRTGATASRRVKGAGSIGFPNKCEAGSL